MCDFTLGSTWMVTNVLSNLVYQVTFHVTNASNAPFLAKLGFCFSCEIVLVLRRYLVLKQALNLLDGSRQDKMTVQILV